MTPERLAEIEARDKARRANRDIPDLITALKEAWASIEYLTAALNSADAQIAALTNRLEQANADV